MNSYLKSITGSQEFIDKYKDILPPKGLPIQFTNNSWVGLSWTQKDLGVVAKYSTYLLLTVGALVATWLTIVLNIIKISERAGGQWANLVQYVLYPIVTAILISIITFLKKLGVTIPAPFSLSLFIGFLLLNAVYTTIQEAEHLANASYGAEDK